ncbi:hypothetical protein PBY51_016936 [Eleginops maclovinus]|uniref:Uncharacterized protein n=1 Tax=Eleginops maclovinus TaxID=56733 RepID=A0AAN7WSJ7_ELEMC|nr:hypothetical protein PBY51_016936 [Eleginops maclovinus]
MERQVASLLARSRRPLVSRCPLPARSGSPVCSHHDPGYAPSSRGRHSHEPGPLKKRTLPEECVCVAVNLEGVSASINTAPAEGDTCG